MRACAHARVCASVCVCVLLIYLSVCLLTDLFLLYSFNHPYLFIIAATVNGPAKWLWNKYTIFFLKGRKGGGGGGCLLAYP